MAKADRICRDALRETASIGERFLDSPGASGQGGDPLSATTEGLFAPGLELRERQADRLRELERPAEGRETLDLYLELFVPIEELIRQRLDAGRRGNPEQARRLELLMAELGDEQAQAAHRFGLRDCDNDFMGATFPR